MRTGSLLMRIVRISFFSLFFAYLLLTIIATATEQGDVNVVIKELGEELLNPLQNAQEAAGTLKESNEGFLDGVWKYWGFYYSVFILFLWLKVIQTLIVHWLLAPKETSGPFKRWGFTLAIFYIILVLHSVIFLGESVNYPFIATKDIFSTLWHVIINFDFEAGVESLISTKENTCTDGVCVA